MSSPQDPFAPPGDGEQQPPSYGSQPPTYGAQPPAYGSQPPPYGSQPPAYGSQPPAYGSQPPAYGSQPPAYGQQPYGQAYYAPSYPKNGLAVWSLVLAVLSFMCFGPLSSIPGAILGHLALKANAQGLADNRGLALAGTIVSWVSLVLSILGGILFFATGAFDEFMTGFEAGMAG